MNEQTGEFTGDEGGNTTKAIEYERERSRILGAWEEIYPYPRMPEPVNPAIIDARPELLAVRDDGVVVWWENGYWLVKYTEANGKFTFAPRNEWQPVKQEWVASKGIPLHDEDDNTTKAGRRLAGAKLTAAQEALATLVGIVKWAAYDDGEDATDDGEDAAEAKTIDDFDAHETKDVDYAIKAIAPGRIRGYAVLWGNEAQKDLTGEWFTPRTEELETVFKSIGRLPWLYHHGGDGRVKSIVAGVVDAMGRDEIGLWYEAQRLMADDYDKYIDSLIDQGKLRTSSGALPRSRAVTKSGEIKRWAIMEVSGTPVPTDWRQRDFPVAAIKTLPDDDDQAKGAEKARQIAIELERIELLKLR